MIRKIGALGISLLCLGAIISCEKDFNDIGTNVVSNTKFETGEILLDVEITPIDLESVRADNITIRNLGEYLLGVYNPANGKKNEATIVSQLFLPTTLNIEQDIEDGEIINPPHLDEVILKIPLSANLISKKEIDNPNNPSEKITVPEFEIDNHLGNLRTKFSLNVYRGNTFLNSLNPNDPSKNNSFESNFDYEKLSPPLASINEFRFLNNNVLPNEEDDLKNIDTLFVFERTLINGNKYNDTLKVPNGDNITANPFKTIRLDKAKLKADVFDKYNDPELSSQDLFNDYFRNIIIEAKGSNGAIIPLNLNLISNNLLPSIEFIHTSSITKNGIVTDTIQKTDSFLLSGIKNSVYKMSTAPIPPTNNFLIQGTAGMMAEVKILDNNKLQELRSNNWLINDAALTFHVNKSINTDEKTTPQKLFLYQNKSNNNGSVSPTQLTDAYMDASNFDGSLELTEDNKPEKYTFKITNYISDLLNGKNDSTTDPLILKVYNSPTDNAVNNNVLNTTVQSYNWNPRGVTLLDGNETKNGANRAVLKISYSKEK